jgi:pimeloyl-ACP methyl ester carboxylesterase
LRLGLTALALVGCAAQNRLGLPVRLESRPYTFRGEALEFEAAVPPTESPVPPVLVLLEGDGSQCQAYSKTRWSRFVTREMGHFVLVRPRTLVNSLCEREPERWKRLDFLHRVDELETLVPAVRQAFPDGPLILVGHSAGAHVARLYAERHPDQVAGLVNISGGYDELSGVLTELSGTPPVVLSSVRSASPTSELWGRTAGFWEQMFFSGVRPLWLTYRKPCLVLHGSGDRKSVPIAGVKRDAAAVTGSCRLEILEGEGHDTLTSATFGRIDAWLQTLPR